MLGLAGRGDEAGDEGSERGGLWSTLSLFEGGEEAGKCILF